MSILIQNLSHLIRAAPPGLTQSNSLEQIVAQQAQPFQTSRLSLFDL